MKSMAVGTLRSDLDVNEVSEQTECGGIISTGLNGSEELAADACCPSNPKLYPSDVLPRRFRLILACSSCGMRVVCRRFPQIPADSRDESAGLEIARQSADRLVQKPHREMQSLQRQR